MIIGFLGRSSFTKRVLHTEKLHWHAVGAGVLFSTALGPQIWHSLTRTSPLPAQRACFW